MSRLIAGIFFHKMFPKKIGITGGIGAGKSVVSTILLAMGYPVYFSDEQAKLLMQVHPDIRRQLIELFGEDVYSGNELNRTFLAERLFADPALREAVNQIVHPVVRADFAEWASRQTAVVVFQESALLFETGGYRLLGATILVTAPEAIRLQRVMKRDDVSEEQVRARMTAQMADSEKEPLASAIIRNDEQELVIPQVLKVLAELSEKEVH